MSLVGTRPILQDELQKYELHHRARIAIKPGITGMWQVSGRSDITDFEEVVRLDTEYISNWNFGLDIKILFDRLVGRIDEINEVYQEIVEGDGKLMVTGVGGLGKTVVVQQFLNKLQNTPTEESQIEKIAWIPYDNHDICLSMKQALHGRAVNGEKIKRNQN